MISIIIPAYNEAGQIEQTIAGIKRADNLLDVELIVVDGGSTDDTVAVAQQTGVIVNVSERKGRAAQMNLGASVARGTVLYFLHADSVPPAGFIGYIKKELAKGTIAGCFRLRFDHRHWFLQANCWFTRFNVNAVRFGDQSLFVTKAVFEQAGKFREDLLLMEDQEIIRRIRKRGRFAVMHAVVTTSARKYIDNGIFRMQAIFFRLWFLYYLGYSQQRLLQLHRRLIHKNKL